MKNKIQIFTSIILLLPLIFYAQSVPENHVATHTYFLGSNGLVLETAKNLDKRPAMKSYRYGAYALQVFNRDLELQWSASLPELKGNEFRNAVVGAKGGELLYFINGIVMNNRQTLVQLKKDGQSQSLDMGDFKEVGLPRAVFCDDEAMYMVNYPITKRQYEKCFPPGLGKLKDPGLSLFTIDHENFKKRKTILDLPKSDDVMRTSFWQPLGHLEGNIYLKRNELSADKGNLVFRILVFDGAGQRKRELELSPPLKSGIVQPTLNTQLEDGNWRGVNDDFTLSPSYNLARAKAGAFGDVYLDAANRCFYVYGLTGPERNKKAGSTLTGYFIEQYDLDGKLIWSQERKAPENMTTKGAFGRFIAPDPRTLSLLMNETGKVKLLVSNNIHFHLFEFNDSDGQQGASSSWKVNKGAFISTGLALRPSGEAKSLKAYATRRKVQKIRYNKIDCYAFPGGDIVVDMDDLSKPDIKLFKHNQ